MWMRWGGTVFWALGRPGAVRGGSCCLSCAAAGCPAGSVVGLAVYDSPGWAHRAAVCEYVTAYTFLCAPCLRCYRLSLDSFSARVAMARSCARAEPEVGPATTNVRAGRAAGSAPRQSCLLVSPAPRPSLRPADATTPPCRVEARRGARAAHKAKPRRHYADYPPH